VILLKLQFPIVATCVRGLQSISQCWRMVASFPLVASKDALHPRNLRLLRRRRITSTQRTSVGKHAGDPEKKANVDGSSCYAKCVQGLTLTEAHERRKERPQTPPKPEDGQERGGGGGPPTRSNPRNLRRKSVEGWQPSGLRNL